ncbi:MAG: 5-deoxy-glucuronate isomerase [Salinisphaera sp.]|jgi:5-deoxy-glucuronate isomerase|nr:5-deoxy-glucuronate isomerase [Salinisphaera sp.]
MHIPPYDNDNRALVDVDDSCVPLVYFNIVKLTRGESFDYRLEDFETCVVPATGSVEVVLNKQAFGPVGRRTIDVWDEEPEGLYVPTNTPARLTCVSDRAEVFVAGAKYAETLKPFVVMSSDIDQVQYGSDDTKTHRKIKHILGKEHAGQVGRLLVSELYTVGAGGWSGFPSHKHDEDRLPSETHHDEAYNFRFRPSSGSGLQMLQRIDNEPGDAYHIVDGSTVLIDKGYHPCCALPGYQMYYFTILAGESQRPLVQYFQPTHADQVETIPGIKDMVAKFA